MKLLALLLFAACASNPPPAPGPGGEVIASDTFDGPAGSDLAGRGWVPALPERLVLTPTGRVRPDSVGRVGALYWADWVPTGPDYGVRGAVVPTTLAGDGSIIGLVARGSSKGAVSFGMHAFEGSYELILGETGGTSVSSPPAGLALQPYQLRLVVAGAKATGYLDTTAVLTLALPPALAEGVAGVFAYQEDPPGDAAGLQLDDFAVLR